jgi:hypothetical protein
MRTEGVSEMKGKKKQSKDEIFDDFICDLLSNKITIPSTVHKSLLSSSDFKLPLD